MGDGETRMMVIGVRCAIFLWAAIYCLSRGFSRIDESNAEELAKRKRWALLYKIGGVAFVVMLLMSAAELISRMG